MTTPFVPSNKLHLAILARTYTIVTGYQCPRIPDEKWNLFGFSTKDPLQDLRKGGLLTCLIILAAYKFTPELIKEF